MLVSIVWGTMQGGFAQDSVSIASKEDAIEILRSSEFVQIYRFTDDDRGNVERLLREIDKTIPIDDDKKILLRNQLLDAAQLVVWPMDRPPFIGTAVDAMLKNNFNTTEYEILSSRLTEGMENAVGAYYYLKSVYKEQTEREAGEPVIFSLTHTPSFVNMIYEYFDI